MAEAYIVAAAGPASETGPGRAGGCHGARTLGAGPGGGVTHVIVVERP